MDLVADAAAPRSLAGADLRGQDFTGADLHGADLSRVRSGVTRRWQLVLTIGSFVVSIGLGVIVGVCVRFLRALYVGNAREHLVAVFVVVSLSIFLVTGIWKGLRFATNSVLPITATLAVAAGLLAVLSGMGTGASALAAIVFLVLAGVIVALSVLVRAVAGTVGRVVFSVVAVAGGLAGGTVGGGVIAAAVAVSAMLMARRSERLEGRFPLLARTTAAIVARGGTSFRNANLAGANLEQAELIACDFRGADLTGTRFDRATLRLCRFERGASVPAT